MLISDDYRQLNTDLHEQREDYGTTARLYVNQIRELAESMGKPTVLDYGCGKGLLKQGLPGVEVNEYDPCIPGKDEEPPESDLVVSIDVLEHIEPSCLDDVLDHMREKTCHAAFLTVATAPAKKFLADGRNAHLIVEPVDWWMPKLLKRWSPRLLHTGEGQFVFLGAVSPVQVAKAA